MNIIATIIPVFIVIFIGYAARSKELFSEQFLSQANQMVYYLAVPVMVFHSIAGSGLQNRVDPKILFACIAALAAAAFAGWVIQKGFALSDGTRASFIQCGFHGNLGYIAFAISYYYAGDQGLAKTAILSGFVMIIHNIMAIILLQYSGSRTKGSHTASVGDMIRTVGLNPVILSALAGILYSLTDLPIPVILGRTFDILKSMALPLALLIIGGSISLKKIRPYLWAVLASSLVKLILMPLIGYGLFVLLDLRGDFFVPGIIVLAAPSATLTVVLAKQLKGDPELGAAAVSFSTLACGATYMFWLAVA